jgi:ATP-dependent helicase HrpB
MNPLPIDEHLRAIQALVHAHRALVIVAPPGAGKTTRVPPALIERGPVIVLQPRRIAARSLARRIASERGWTLGREVGWQVRFEKNFTRETRLLIATEGILTARLQGDPLLSDFATVVVDEFHERSIHADLALALARQAMLARSDLAVVVMSATIDPEPIAAFLDGAPVVRVEGRLHPVEVSHRPDVPLRTLVQKELAQPGGHTLVFLPGAPEIGRAAGELARLGAPIFPLHGSLPSEQQDAAIATAGARERRVILATNIAETSLTVEGVTSVIDSGMQKVMRYDPAVGLDRLETERISLQSAEQRAGRAGRVAPGRAIRMWDARQQLRPAREREIDRVDLAGPLLAIFAWGADPREFDWFERPPGDSLARAVELLEDLGAVRDGRITEEGRRMQRLPLHPRQARIMITAGGARRAAVACAILSEGLRWAEGREEVDLLDLVARFDEAAPAVRRAAEEIGRAWGRRARDVDDDGLRRALHAGFADRLARRRPGTDRFLLANGTGAALSRGGAFPPGAQLLVALDIVAGKRGAPEAVIRLAAVVDEEWVRPTRVETEQRFDPATRSVRQIERDMVRELVLRERESPAGPEDALPLLARTVTAILESAEEEEPLSQDLAPLYGAREIEEAVQIIRRARAAGVAIDVEAIAVAMARGSKRLPALELARHLPRDAKRRIDSLAPSSIAIPSGRSARLEYRRDGSVFLSVKLQELFGLAESPRVGAAKVPVTIELLSPGGRPVQTTRDLRSFWDGGYHEVRKELRGRYPKHPWPEDPWNAPATARAKRRRTSS